MEENNVLIFDTTLRDGEQGAGATMTVDQKIDLAKQLELLGVDVLEAGFPVSSPGELESVRKIAQTVRKPIVCGLAHANPKAIDKAWEALQDAARPRIHIFLSTSDIHMLHQLRKDREEVLNMAQENVARAKKLCSDIEFSPMDATRSDPEYVYRLLEATIDAGATTVNIPDTVGYTTPEEFGKFIQNIRKNVRNIEKARISVHCHNDLGLAVANSLSAVKAGARQIECTVNGIGERAGNAAMEEVVMAMRTRKDFFGLATNIDTTQIYRTSRLVSEYTGFTIQPNKAIIGNNAFRHASGIHQDGILKDRSTYEIMDPQSVGWPGSMLVLGKLSGRHAFKKRLEDMGYNLTEEQLQKSFDAFKLVAEKKKEVTDRDLEALMKEERTNVPEIFKLEHIHVSCGTNEIPTATVSVLGPNGTVTDAAIGTGPVDAAYKAINKIVNVPASLQEYTVQSVTAGIDAVGDVTVRIEKNGMMYLGKGVDTDVIVASAKAYLNALNLLIAASGELPRPAYDLASVQSIPKKART
ncbi:MAG: 2-isopropylmalate synthase [Dehalococcoidia bacterium]|nr:2-isopropylmalate synthase [Dehalococcoidia bacterium]